LFFISRFANCRYTALDEKLSEMFSRREEDTLDPFAEDDSFDVMASQLSDSALRAMEETPPKRKKEEGAAALTLTPMAKSLGKSLVLETP
jgi:hypothetical protein